MPTLVCVPITMQDADSALADATAAKAAGADLVEFRVDEFFTGSEPRIEAEIRAIVRVVSRSPLPCIVTCRVTSEGGAYEGDEMARVSLYERLGTAQGPGEHPPRFLDCELASYASSANLRMKVDLAVDHARQLRDLNTSLILSMHDFATRPADLTRRLLDMRSRDAARVLKIAYRARSLRDSLELLGLCAESDRPMIALGMGEFGLMSRVLAPMFGGFLTFAALRASSATAPGQPTVQELLELYRFRSISPTTKVYGVVGWPVGHSLSPMIHNDGFARVGHDGVYLPLPVAAPDGPGAAGGYESFKATVLELIDHPRLNFSGASVTIPHKENLARLAIEQRWEFDAITRATGAANTLVVERAGGRVARARVANTDAPAALACVESALRRPVADLRCVVLGAGGVSAGIAHALAAAGARVTVLNRTPARAAALGRRLDESGFEARAAALDAFDGVCDVVVNGTPLGMAGGPDPAGCPIDVGVLRPGTVVMDTVYNPARTPLLVRARAAGLSTVDGVAMFVRQAAAQFGLWTGASAPADAWDAMVRERLSR